MTSPPPPNPSGGWTRTSGAPPDGSPFVPGPPVAPTKGAGGGPNFNPNIRIDTSTTTSTGTPREWTESAPTVDDQGNVHHPKGGDEPAGPDEGDDAHYAAGHQIGSALGAHLANHVANQILAEIERMFNGQG